MEIRKIKPEDDRHVVSHIYVESWKSAYKGIIAQSWLDHLSEEMWDERLNSSDRNTLLMIEEDRILGVSSFGLARDKRRKMDGEIYSIYLLPAIWHQGYGTQLITEVIKELKQMGYPRVYVWVLKENYSARRFYEHCGFQNSKVENIIEIAGESHVELCYEMEWKQDMAMPSYQKLRQLILLMEGMLMETNDFFEEKLIHRHLETCRMEVEAYLRFGGTKEKLLELLDTTIEEYEAKSEWKYQKRELSFLQNLKKMVLTTQVIRQDQMDI